MSFMESRKEIPILDTINIGIYCLKFDEKKFLH